MKMPYSIIIENRAQKEFLKLPAQYSAAARLAIDALAENPRPYGVKKLAGSKDGYRVRVGGYRILYTIEDNRRLVTVYRIKDRKDVYR
jgi:mRNA interferase RelE/StbE